MQKLNLVCGNENEYQYILVTKEKTIATDKYCFVSFETKSLFGDAFYNQLKETDRFLIHKNDWIKLTKPYLLFKLVDDKIEISRKANITDFIILKKEGEDVKYNDVFFLEVMSKFVYEGESVDKLGINIVLHQNMQKALYPEVPSTGLYPLYLHFPNDYLQFKSPIKITTDNNDFQFDAYIMPIKSNL